MVVFFEERDGKGKERGGDGKNETESVCVSCVCVWGPTQ